MSYLRILCGKDQMMKLPERRFLFEGEVTVGDEEVFHFLWRGRAPSKVLAFS